MSENKKILFVIPYLCDGGAERALSNITTHFPEDYDIDILVNSDKQVDYEYRGNIISMGIDSEKKVDSVWFQLKVLLKRIRKLRKIKEENNYIACISFMDSANIANILTKRKQIKTIVSIRMSLSNVQSKAYRYIINPLVKILYNRAEAIVIPSQELAIELINDFHLNRDKVVTIENGYDIYQIEKLADEPLNFEENEIIGNRPFLFTAGRLSEPKRQWHLIRAMHRVTEEFPDVLLYIAGSGELKDYLNSLIDAYHLEKNVKLIGNTKNVFMYEKRADIFVFPSGWEGFPNALVEALCVGTPCIATDFKTGAREILAPELLKNHIELSSVNRCSYGVVTPICSGNKYSADKPLEESEFLLADAIIELLKDDDLRENYRNRSIERGRYFGIDEAIKKWRAIIE